MELLALAAIVTGYTIVGAAWRWVWGRGRLPYWAGGFRVGRAIRVPALIALTLPIWFVDLWFIQGATEGLQWAASLASLDLSMIEQWHVKLFICAIVILEVCMHWCSGHTDWEGFWFMVARFTPIALIFGILTGPSFGLIPILLTPLAVAWVYQIEEKLPLLSNEDSKGPVELLVGAVWFGGIAAGVCMSL
jgi:hypothetical protein